MLRIKATVTMKRTFKNFNRDSFPEDLSRVPSHAAYVFDDLDDVYWCWETLYNQVLDDHAPMRSFTGAPNGIACEYSHLSFAWDANERRLYSQATNGIFR